jgi:hypothetical protein
MKAFNPHYHKADQKRLLKLQDYINRKYHLINPFEANRRQTLELNTNWTNRNQAKERIDQIVTTAISQEVINSRQELVSFFKDNGLQVKESKNYIAIKSKEDKKYTRLKGAYYNESFTSRGELAKELARTEQEHRADTHKQHKKLREELNRLIQYKAKQISKQYTKKCKNFTDNATNVNNIQSNTSGLYADTKQSNQLEQERISLDTKKTDIERKEQSVYIHTEQEHTDKHRQHNSIYRSGELNDDSIGTTTARSITNSSREEQELISNSTTVRERIQEQYLRDSQQLRAAFENAAQRTYTAIEKHNKRAKSIQSKSIKRARDTSTTKSAAATAIKSIARSIKEFIEKLRPPQLQSRSFGRFR